MIGALKRFYLWVGPRGSELTQSNFTQVHIINKISVTVTKESLYQGIVRPFFQPQSDTAHTV